MIRTHIEEIHVANQDGDITHIEIKKHIKIVGIPILKFSFVKHIDVNNYVPQSPPASPKVTGFEISRIKTRGIDEIDDEEMKK